MNAAVREPEDEEQYDDDDEYEVPLHQKKPFGSGIRRQRIEFVKASDADLSTIQDTRPENSGASIKDETTEALDEAADGKTATARRRRKHEASIAHQVCVAHSHPPSALDRARMGLTYLSSHGWDPDARKGLGSEGQGIQYPLKTKPKDDKLGLGLAVPKDFQGRVEKKKPVTLDAKKSRQKAEADKKKGEKLREMFYGSEDVQRYLGSG
ncbi:D-lactate dehydrogenase [Verticillium dahliae VDG1]|nr:D-lactate dehydrogenase [Verticillium dahliae VDG1]